MRNRLNPTPVLAYYLHFTGNMPTQATPVGFTVCAVTGSTNPAKTVGSVYYDRPGNYISRVEELSQ